MKFQDTTQRIFYLDVLRVLAIFGVITIHLSGRHLIHLEQLGTQDWWIANILNSASRVSIPIFLMLTGALLFDRDLDQNPWQVAQRRLFRLVIPFLFWSALYEFYKQYVINQSNAEIWSVIKIGWAELLAGNIYPHLWFMYVIIAIYLVAPFIHRAVHGAQEKEIRYLLMIWFVGTLCWFNLTKLYSFFSQGQSLVVTELDIPLAAHYSGYVILGYYLQRFPISEKWRTISYRLGLLSVVVTPMLVFGMTQGHAVLNETFYSPYALTSAFMANALFVFAQRFSWDKVPPRLRVLISAISGATFGIYFIHMIIQDWVERSMQFGQEATMLSFLLINGLLVLAVSFVIIKLFNLDDRLAKLVGA